MAFFRIRRHRRGYNELEGNTRFMDRVEFMQGSGLLLKRSVNFYADVKDGDDANNGLSMDRPFASITAAAAAMNARIDWAESPWARRDNLYIAPGKYEENLTALPYGCNIIGLGFDVRDGENGVKIESAKPVDVDTLINTSFYNIGFISTGAGAAFDAAICNNVLFDNCFFSGPAETTTCVKAFITSDSTKTTFRDCWFCNAKHGAYFNYTDGGDKVAYLLMEHCIISGCDTTGIYTHTNLVGPHSIVRHCTIVGAGKTLAKGIDDNAGVIDEAFNAIEATAAVEGVRTSNGSYGKGVLLT